MVCQVCGVQNDGLSLFCSGCGVSLAAEHVHALPVGTELFHNGFRIESVLGQGGFGITYVARDLKLDREVAIKEFFPSGCGRQELLVRPGGIDPADFATARQKFVEEARVLARFNHPNIVNVYSVFEENNSAYMVMELLRGKTLAQLIVERGVLDEAIALPYMEAVGDALAHVHETGLLHRDIKPENVIVTGDGRAVLIDFGSARDFATRHTRRQSVILTPGYAPLEQYAQQARHGAYTDVYALAATLYHMLTGRMPVAATDRVIGTALMEVRLLNPRVSAAVSTAIARAMEMEIAKRPQCIEEFLTNLQGLGSPLESANQHEGISPAPQSPPKWPVIFGPPNIPDPQVNPTPHAISAPRIVLPKQPDSGPQARGVLQGHGEAINCVAISPDSTRIATGSSDQTVRVWNLQNQTLICVLSGQTGRITCVEFSSDGQLLASGSLDGYVRIWDVATGSVEYTFCWNFFQFLLGQEGWITDLAFSPSDLIIVTSSSSYASTGAVTLWGLEEKKQLKHFREKHHVNSIAFSPDGLILVAVDSAGGMTAWDTRDWRILWERTRIYNLSCVSFAPDGKFVAVASDSYPVSFYSSQNGYFTHQLQGLGNQAKKMAFSPDGKMLATVNGRLQQGGYDDSIRLWNMASAESIHTLAAHRDGVNDVCFSPDGKWLVSGSADKTAIIWEL